MRSAVAVLMLLVVVAVPVHAKLTLDVSAFGEPIKPDVEVRAFAVNATVDCQTIMKLSPPVVGEEVEIHVSFDVVEGVVVAGRPVILLTADPCRTDPQASISQATLYTLQAARSVQAGIPLTLTTTARMDGNQFVAAEEATSNTTFQVDYFGLIQARVEEKITQFAPGEHAIFRVTFTNHGNAATRIEPWRVTVAPPFFAAPSPAIVVERGETGHIDLNVTATAQSGWNNREAAVSASFNTSADFDHAKRSDVQVVTMLAHLRGYSTDGNKASPAPLFGVVAMALAAAAFARRRA